MVSRAPTWPRTTEAATSRRPESERIMPRERKPVDEHKLQGTRPQYVNPEAIIPAGRPKYPRGISNDAKRVFKTIARLLEQRRSLSEGDGELMRLLAIAY